MFNTTAYGKAVVKYTGAQKPGFSDFRLLPIAVFLDMRKTFPDTLQDFNFEIQEFGFIENFREVC